MALKRESYFISPEFRDEFRNVRTVSRDDGDGGDEIAGTLVNDEKDDLVAWIKENTLPHETLGRGAVTYWGGKLVGENGVYCEMITDKSRRDVSGKVNVGFLGDSGSYRRVVRILATPSSKSLPAELLEALVSRQYAEANENNLCVKEFSGYF